MAEQTIYDPNTKRRLTPQEEALACMFAQAALTGIMSRSPSELEMLTTEAITKQIWKQALSMVEARRKLGMMYNVLKD